MRCFLIKESRMGVAKIQLCVKCNRHGWSTPMSLLISRLAFQNPGTETVRGTVPRMLQVPARRTNYGKHSWNLRDYRPNPLSHYVLKHSTKMTGFFCFFPFILKEEGERRGEYWGMLFRICLQDFQETRYFIDRSKSLSFLRFFTAHKRGRKKRRATCEPWGIRWHDS